MNENLEQINPLLIEWYKTFGVSHLLDEFDCIRDQTVSQGVLQKESSVRKVLAPKPLQFADLDELKKAVFQIDCPLKKTARNTVFSDGDPKAGIMFLGEAPGQEEDEQGKPFVGQSGKLLNNMLESVGLKRSDVYISNILFWRPPGNRTPSSEEIALCLPYVEQHVRLVKPKVIVLLGGVAVKSVLNTNLPISKLRGIPNSYLGIYVIPTFHPAYLLRSPAQKALAFRDFITLRKFVG